jgi:hypothetical protein
MADWACGDGSLDNVGNNNSALDLRDNGCGRSGNSTGLIGGRCGSETSCNQACLESGRAVSNVLSAASDGIDLGAVEGDSLGDRRSAGNCRGVLGRRGLESSRRCRA